MANTQNTQVAQAALFLIDNTEPCPAGQNFREFTDAAITEHLTRHTYYYQHYGKTGDKNRRRATVKWFRGTVFRNLWKNTKPESQQSGNVTDALFHMKSESITAEALQTYGYNPESFSESNLSGFVVDNGDDLDSREQSKAASTPAPDLPAQVPSSKRRLESSDDFQQQVAKRARLESRSTDTDRQDPFSHPPQASQEPASAPSMRTMRELQSSDEPQQHTEKPSLVEDHVASKILEGSSSHMPDSSQELPPAPVRNKRRQEPSDEPQQHATKRPRNDTVTASTEWEEGPHKLPRCKRCVRVKKGVCDRQRPCNNCKAAGIDVAGCAGEEQDIQEETRSHPDPTTTSNTTASKHKGTSQPGNVGSRLDMPQESKDVRSDEVEGPTASDHTTASLGKRKRETNDTGIEAGSHEIHAARTSGQPALPKRQATEPSVEVSVADGEARPPAPLLQGTTSGASNVTNGSNTSTTNSANAPRSSNTAPNRKSQTQQVNWADVRPLDKQLKKIRQRIEEATHEVFACIGKIQNSICPLDLEPTEQLAALYARCWGPDWEKVTTDYTERGMFRTYISTVTLISAFLYDKILNQQAYDKETDEEFLKQLRASGPTGEAYLQIFDRLKTELDIPKAARSIAIDRARDMLSQDDATVQSQLQSEAEALTKDFWNTALPHFRSYTTIAKCYRLSSGQSEDALSKVFEAVITPIVQKTLYHKLYLVAVGCEYAYFWPRDGDTMDDYAMDEFGAFSNGDLVMYTVFPGLRLTLPVSNDHAANPVVRASVTTKRTPSKVPYEMPKLFGI